MKSNLNNAFNLGTRVNWEHADYQIQSFSWLPLTFQMPVDQLLWSSVKTLDIRLKTPTYFILPIYIYSFSYSKRFWVTMLTGTDFTFLVFLECSGPKFSFFSQPMPMSCANESNSSSLRKDTQPCLPFTPQKYFSFKNMFTFKTM